MPAFLIPIVCLALLMVTSRAAQASSPHITLSPKSGPPTSIVKVSGTNFGASEIVSITFDTTQLATITTSTTGAFSLKIPVPASAQPGNHRVQAIGQSSGLSAQTTFLVQTNWPMFGFDPRHTRYNPYENVLNPSNVSNLTLDWKAANVTSSSSPAVVNGVVY